MNIIDRYIKSINEQITKDLGLPIFPDKYTAATAASSNLTIEHIEDLSDKMLSSKIEIKPVETLAKNNMFVMDHEEIRKTIPWYKERGKTIFCHPDDEPMIRSKIYPNR